MAHPTGWICPSFLQPALMEEGELVIQSTPNFQARFDRCQILQIALLMRWRRVASNARQARHEAGFFQAGVQCLVGPGNEVEIPRRLCAISLGQILRQGAVAVCLHAVAAEFLQLAGDDSGHGDGGCG
jgi:hypothetical protein